MTQITISPCTVERNLAFLIALRGKSSCRVHDANMIKVSGIASNTTYIDEEKLAQTAAIPQASKTLNCKRAHHLLKKKQICNY